MSRDLLRDGLRSLRQDLRGTIVAICLLALTIGAVTAIYAIVQAVVLRPFLFADQDRLAVLWQRDDRRALPIIEVAYGEMVDWRARSRSFTDLAVVGSVNWSMTLTGTGTPQPVEFAAVSASFFSVVGVRPLLGRALVPADEEGSIARVMVISHGLWTGRFGRDPSIVGRVVSVLDGGGPPIPTEIVGVMPDEFDFPRGADAWLPAAPLVRKDGAAFGGPDVALPHLRVFYAVGRLREGVSTDAAAREVSQVMRTADQKGGPEPPQSVVVTAIATYLLGPAGPVLRTLLAGAALMLLIACANVAGLQVARTAQRQRALAIRVALGASGRHLIQQIALESALITATALAGAVGVAFVIARAMVALAPAAVPRLDRVTFMDGPVFAFAAIAAFVTLALCALWPALVARRVEVVSLLTHGPTAGTLPTAGHIQRAVVVFQIAMALTLLSGSALFFRTVRGLDQTTLGFDPDGLLAFAITPTTPDVDRWNASYDAIIARVMALPTVRGAGAVLRRPLSGPIGWDNQPIYPGQVPADPSTWGLNAHVNFEVVTPGYFQAMGIRLVRGRLFTASDSTTAPGVAIVSASAARRLWPDREPLGQRLRDPTYRAADSGGVISWQTVVGVVDDARYRGLNDVRLDLYCPATQSRNQVQQLMVRTSGDLAGVIRSIRTAAHVVDPTATVSEGTLMRDVVDAESAPWRFLMRVFVSFAALAAGLAAVGLGAVIATTMSARRRELAIRAALGADRARLRSLVLGEALWLVLAGIAAGLAGAIALGSGVSRVLIGVGPHDVTALSTAALVAAATGLAASWFAARRAANADPLEAMRTE